MDYILIPIMMLFISVAVLAIYVYGKKSLNKMFQEIAQEYNLQYGEGSFFSNPWICGRVNDVDLTCLVQRMNKQTVFRIQAVPVNEFPFEICITTETTLTRFKRLIGKNDIQTGDAEFDNRILIKDSEAGVIAMLNKKARSIILSLVKSAVQFEISTDNIDIFFSKENEDSTSMISKIKQIIDLIHELSRAKDLKTLAADNIKHDPVVSVRKRNLEMLIEHYEHVPAEIEEILGICLEDPAWQVSVTTAPYMGKKGRDHLIKLLAQATLQAKIQAAKALGTCGVLKTVKHLHEIMNKAGIPARLKNTIKQSIAEIHARLAQGEEAGRLSVAEMETGKGSLSMADNNDGALSLPGEKQKTNKRKKT